MNPQLLTDESVHPITLLHELTKKYGADWMEWAPSVLRKTLEKDFKISPARVNLIKAMGAGAVATRDEFWESWETFHFLCQALNGLIPSHEELQTHSVGEMMVAVDIALQIRRELGSLSHVPTFSEEVAKYIAAHALNQGVWYLPEPLSFASRFASKRWYRCKDCGNEAEDLFGDGLCDVCVQRFDTESLRNWVPNPKLVEKGEGRNIVYYEKNPSEKVKKRLDEAIHKDVTLQETPVDICVDRLLRALQYVAYRRGQFQGAAA